MEEDFNEENYETLDNEMEVNPSIDNKNHNSQSMEAKEYTDAAKLAAEGLATFYGGKLGGAAVKAFSKTNLGQKTFNTVGNVANNAGNMVRRPINIFNPYSNVINNNITEDARGLDNEKDNKLPNKELDNNKETSNNKKEDKKNNSKEKNDSSLLGDFKVFKKKAKLFLIIVSAIFFILIFALFIGIADKDFAMLDLTGSIYKPSDKGTSNGGAGSSIRQVERGLLYVGDERILEMKTYIQSTTIKFIGRDKADYNWLSSQGRSQISNQISEDSQIKYVVVALGLYDLENADKYLNLMNSLIASNDKIKYLFMSVGPVREGQAPKEMTRARINEFNNKMKNRLGERFIDITDAVGTNFTSSDGIKYDGTTYRAIHAAVLSYIRSTFSQGFLDEYPHGTEGTIILPGNIVTVLGESGYNDLNNAVKSGIENSGLCNKETAAIAGINLAYGLYELGYRLPYYWNGGHDMHTISDGSSAYVDYYGVDKKLGDKVGTQCSTDNCYSKYGYDCTGFVNWAVSAAMGKDVSIGLDGWFGNSISISLEEAEPGDIILTSGHAILVLENKGDYLQTLESTGGSDDGNLGLIFRTYNATEISNISGSVRSLNPYYESMCG